MEPSFLEKTICIILFGKIPKAAFGFLSIPDGMDKSFKLVGCQQNKDSVGYLVISEKGNIYWMDPFTGSKYRTKVLKPSQKEFDLIPTAIGEPYFPVYK